MECLSANYADYYLGVSGREADRTTFSEYQLDSSMQPVVTLGGYCTFNQQWQLITNFRFQQLATDIKDCTIIESSNSVGGFITVIYDF